MDVGIDNLVVLCYYEFEPLFVINMKEFSLVTDSYEQSSAQLIRGTDLTVTAIDPLAAKHP